jgi:hypothetical protein
MGNANGAKKRIKNPLWSDKEKVESEIMRAS